MAFSAVGTGLWYAPYLFFNGQTGINLVILVSDTIDAANEKVCYYGRLYIQGRAASKTLSSSGGSIGFRTGTVTWATSGTTVRVGVQDLLTSGVTRMTPDGTFDVYGDLVQGTDSLSSNSWKTVSMSSGTKTINHGDLIAVVLDMTVRNGTDSVQISRLYHTYRTVPGANTYTTSWSAGGVAGYPNIIITFDDGTLGWFDGVGFAGVSATSSEQFADSDSPDERGNVFQVPWRCMIDAVCFGYDPQSAAAADATIKLYGDPLGTPTELWSQTLYGEQDPAGNENVWVSTLSSPIILSPNTNYALALKATGANSIALYSVTYANADYRASGVMGTNCAYATRNNSSGAFSTTTTKQCSYLGVRIVAIDVGPGPTYQLGI